jgi:hypothetical protein
MQDAADNIKNGTLQPADFPHIRVVQVSQAVTTETVAIDEI